MCVAGKCAKVEANKVVRGLVTSVNAALGLTVQIPQNYQGRVAVTDLADEFEDFPTQKFSEGQMVECCVIKCDKDKRNKCALSLRSSR